MSRFRGKKKIVLKQDELWHIASQWNSVGIKKAMTSHSLGSAQLPGCSLGNHLQPEHQGILPAGAICAYSASSMAIWVKHKQKHVPTGSDVQSILSLLCNSSSAFLYTGLIRNKFFLITASRKATSNFTVEAACGFVGCWERRESNSVYICSFAPFWLCATGNSVSTAASRITAVLDLSWSSFVEQCTAVI